MFWRTRGLDARYFCQFSRIPQQRIGNGDVSLHHRSCRPQNSVVLYFFRNCSRSSPGSLSAILPVGPRSSENILPLTAV